MQMHAGFTLADARRIIPYLHDLGITHAYTSSLLTARPGSKHGYDVTDHGALNPELGTAAELEAFVADLHARGMGLLLDTVPNHMAVGGANAWWVDVLENGPSSPFADYFDIAWYDAPRDRLRGKLLLPILGAPYGNVLESGEFRLAFEKGVLAVRYGDARMPLDPRTYGTVLTPALDAARTDLGPDDAAVELHSILTAVKHLPPREETDASRVAEGRVEIGVIKRRLADLAVRSPEIAIHIAAELNRLAGNPAALETLLDAQAYRPCFWRVASDEINYRRFFDINDLAALSVEREDVFRATHQKVFEWMAAGYVDGLRIDHPDGLFDPKQYLDRLRAEAGDPLYVVVEKILAHRERLPDDWACAGTTGYEFAAVVNGLFVDPAHEADLTRAYETFTGRDEPFPEVVYRNKFLILQTSLSSELHMLAQQLDRHAQTGRWSRDFTLNGLRHALREVIACFPVYRTYIDGGVRDADRPVILRAVRRARARNAVLGRHVFDFIRDTLLLKDPPTGPATDEYRAAQRRFAGKFQQVTSPVMAKGFEDTAMYVFNRLASLNEVGGEPDRFGRPPADVHAAFRERAERSPGGLSPLSTHDTKRGEDVRARINVLSELPDEWAARVARWAALNQTHKVEVEEGVVAPDANEEYLLYQTLVGAWPATGDPPAEFVGRIQAYMNKALHEAKVHSSWINPDADYDTAVATFVARILDPGPSGEFLADFVPFQRRVSHIGAWNSLAQTLVRCTAPGVPDTYQGTEIYDFSLVDPDNRRPVDYAARERMLSVLDNKSATIREMIDAKEDGRIKLLIVSRALRLRRDWPEVFSGAYEPLETVGLQADHIFSYARTAGDRVVLIAVPRLVVGLLKGQNGVPTWPTEWGDTAIRLPDQWRGREWENVFTGEKLTAGTALAAGDVFASFPVALLVLLPTSQ